MVLYLGVLGTLDLELFSFTFVVARLLNGVEVIGLPRGLEDLRAALDTLWHVELLPDVLNHQVLLCPKFVGLMLGSIEELRNEIFLLLFWLHALLN